MPTPDPAEPRRMLDLAARLALRGAGRAEPNPLVGCVLVRDGQIIGMGHHRQDGGPHAEAHALLDVARRGLSPAGATAYVTLEPCAVDGRQPSCARALVSARVARVVYARPDPHPKKGGGGAVLHAAGIACEQSDASRLARGVGAPFSKRVTTGLPWVIAKWAQTIDGRVATRTGESKWISGELARARVHRLRGRVDAIVTGIGTVLADDPLLTARGVRPRRIAMRVVADTDLDLPARSQLVRTARDIPTLVACDSTVASSDIFEARRRALQDSGVLVLGIPSVGGARGIDLRELLRALASAHRVSTVLVEAGPGILGAMLEQDLIDEAVVYIAPMVLGDDLAKAAAAGRVAPSLSHGRIFDLWRVRPLSGDVELTYRKKG
ncbi:MAG: bifunctional diaminohydroxyphosphoribosylaminopyrimidine deaminase/5-amino-6-(5-phosphoribosylamino)uracil reductase RibD [Phycisphaerales bacterium]